MEKHIPDHIGLYYPFIKFKDDNWVKLAALYWDKLGRIVPSDHTPQDSVTVKHLIDEAGFIKNFSPLEDERRQVADLFTGTLLKHLPELVTHYSHKLPTHATGTDYSTHVLLETTPYSNLPWPPNYQDFNPNLSYLLYEGKMTYQLAEMLKRLGFAYSIKHSNKDLIGMHPKLAFVYMDVLAEVMSKGRQFYPVADDEFNYIATSGYTVERLIQALLPSDDKQPHLAKPTPMDHEIEVQMATIALRSVFPKDITNVPVQKIIKLRQRYREEMSIFQRSIHETILEFKQLRSVNDLDALKSHLEVIYETRFQGQLNDLRKYMNSLGLEATEGVINIKLTDPPLLASVEKSFHLAPVNPIIASTGAIAYSFFPVIKQKRKEAHEIIRESPISYLFHIEENLKPVNTLIKLQQIVRHFVLGI